MRATVGVLKPTFFRNLPEGLAGTAKRLYCLALLSVDTRSQPVRAGGAVKQTSAAFGFEAQDPFFYARRANAYSASYGARRFPCFVALDD